MPFVSVSFKWQTMRLGRQVSSGMMLFMSNTTRIFWKWNKYVLQLTIIGTWQVPKLTWLSVINRENLRYTNCRHLWPYDRLQNDRSWLWHRDRMKKVMKGRVDGSFKVTWCLGRKLIKYFTQYVKKDVGIVLANFAGLRDAFSRYLRKTSRGGYPRLYAG